MAHYFGGYSTYGMGGAYGYGNGYGNNDDDAFGSYLPFGGTLPTMFVDGTTPDLSFGGTLPTMFVYGNTDDNFGYGVDFGYFGDLFNQDNFYTGFIPDSSVGGSGGPNYSNNDSSIPNAFRHKDAMADGVRWRIDNLPPIQKKIQRAMEGNLMQALLQGGAPGFVTAVYESIRDAYEADPNSFEANTFLAPNGKTYELPPPTEVAKGTENEIASRINNLYDSFEYLRMFNRSVNELAGGDLEQYLSQMVIVPEDHEKFLNSSQWFPQVINRGDETISRDGTVITYPDGTSFNVDLGDRTNFSPDPNHTFRAVGGPFGFSEDSTTFVEDPNTITNQYGRFYDSFIDEHIENWRLGNDWTTLSIGYDGSIYGETGYDQDGYNRQGHDRNGFDRDGFHYEGYNQDGLDVDGQVWRDENGYDLDGFDVDGFDVDGFDVDGVNTDGLNAQQVEEGYTVSDDGMLVLPVMNVVADRIDNSGDEDGLGLDGDGFGDGFGDDDFDPEGSGFAGMDPNQDIPLEDLVLPDKTAEEQARLNEIANRYGGTRRAYNDFLQSEEGQEAVNNLGDFINDNLSPSGEFDMTKRAELFDRIALIATDNGFAGLNAFAVGVNIIEGITNTNLIDVPNVGYLVDNLTEKFLPDNLLNDIERIVPDFIEKRTGLDAVLQANSDASGYLGQGFDLSAWLLGDLGMVREVDYGLRPATEQLRQQQEDYFREYFGDNVYDRFIATTPEDDPNFLEKIINFGQTVFGGIGDFADDVGFASEKYIGGTLPTNLLNLVGLSSLGLPIGSLANMIGGALAPSGQELSDYLYEQGIDPTTATRSDIGAFLVDRNYNVPGFNAQTGEFEIQTDAEGNEFNIDTDGDGFFDNFASNLADFAGDDTLVSKLINEEITLTDGILRLASGAVQEGQDIFEGVTPGGTDNNNNAGDTVVFDDGNENGTGDGDGNELDVGGNELDVGGNELDVGGSGLDVDGNGSITTGNMSDTDENVYDPAYETAKFILGASEAERFRGVGLGNAELQAIIGDYSSMVGQSEAERLLELNRIEQAGINELRDVQKASDLELLGDYGQQYADAVRGLDPTALAVLGEQKELSDRLYRRAAGDLTEEELADAEERAFEVAASTGRTMDSTRIANVLRAEEDMVANLEARAQQSGTNTYNMSRGLTGNIPAMLLGNQGNPYGTGIGQVTPPLGIGDVISMGTQNYAQNQNIAEAQRQLDIVNAQYDAAIAANEPSKAQEFLARADEIVSYISLANQGLQALSNLPGTVRNVRDTVSNAVSGVRTLFGGGSSAPSYNSGSRFNFTPQEFNVNDYLDLGTFGQGNSSGGGSSFRFDFGDFG